MHEATSASTFAVPRGHKLHDAWPLDEKKPALHIAHTVRFDAAKKPGEQATHSFEPVSEIWPGAQEEQADDSASAVKLPAAHGEHSVPPLTEE